MPVIGQQAMLPDCCHLHRISIEDLFQTCGINELTEMRIIFESPEKNGPSRKYVDKQEGNRTYLMNPIGRPICIFKCVEEYFETD